MIVRPEIEEYVEALTAPPADHLAPLRAAARATQSTPQMLSGPVEGRLLEMLVWISRPRLVLEIGTYSGAAAQFMASALPEGGRVITCELDPDRAAFARKHIEAGPVAERIELREGPALETIDALDGPIDLVFVDANKDGYVDYYEAVLPKLSERGLIAADNTLFSGDVLDAREGTAQHIARFNEHVAADPRTVQVMLSVRDGITLIRRAP